MRLLYVLHNFAPARLYGAEQACLGQLREVLALGHEAALVYAGNEPPAPGWLAEQGLAGLTLFPISYLETRAQVVLSIAKPHVNARFRRLLAAYRPDAVIFHHLVRLSLDLPAIARRAGLPTVYVAHDYYPVCPSYSLLDADDAFCPPQAVPPCATCLFRSRFRRAPALPALLAAPLLALRRRRCRALAAHLDHLTAPAAFLLAALNARGFTVPSQSVIPYGARPAAPTPPRPANAPPVFGFLGHLNRKKGLDVLARALAGSPHRLRIRGFTSPAESAAFRAAHPDLAADCEPFSPDAASFFAGIDALIVPSLWPENQPNGIIEAFSHGRPVLASRIGGIPEMFGEGRGGLFFTAGDATDLRRCIDRFAASPELRAQLAGSIPAWPSWREQTERFLNTIGWGSSMGSTSHVHPGA